MVTGASDTSVWPGDRAQAATARPSSKWAEIGLTLYTAYAFMMMASAFYFLFAGPPEPSSGNAPPTQTAAASNPAYIALWFSLVAISGLMLARRVLAVGLPRGTGLFAAFAFYLLASMLWSQNPTRTLFYSAMAIANLMVGANLALHVAPARLFRILARTISVLLIVSLVMLAVVPDLVSSPRYGGGWLLRVELNGVFGHKSDAGYYFAFLSLLLAHGVGLGLSRGLRVGLVALCFVGILLANSATALVAAIALHGLLVLGRLPNLGGALMVTAATAATVIAVALPFIDIGDLVGVVGREASLTGRVPIWKAAMAFINERPLLGYGYYGFFDQAPFSPVWQLWRIDPYFKTPHFHNSSLDVIVNVGMVGWLFYMALVMMAFAILANATIDRPSRLLAAGCLTLFMVSAAFDFTFLRHITFATTFLGYCVFAAQRDYRQA